MEVPTLPIRKTSMCSTLLSFLQAHDSRVFSWHPGDRLPLDRQPLDSSLADTQVVDVSGAPDSPTIASGFRKCEGPYIESVQRPGSPSVAVFPASSMRTHRKLVW